MAAAMAPGLAFARSRPRVLVPARAKRRGWHATGELRSRPRCTGAFERRNAAPSPSARAADGVRADREGDRYRIDHLRRWSSTSKPALTMAVGVSRAVSRPPGTPAAMQAHGRPLRRRQNGRPARVVRGHGAQLRVPPRRAGPAVGASRVGSPLRRPRGDGKRRAGSLRDLERVRERSLTVAGGLVHTTTMLRGCRRSCFIVAAQRSCGRRSPRARRMCATARSGRGR